MKTNKKNLFLVPLAGKTSACRQKGGVAHKETSFTTPHRPCGALPPQVGKLTPHAFTLIELLVVVLIIGILAAVAVPQYKLAVAKSRVRSMIPIISSIAKADRIYYLANGQYTADTRKLDISMPASCRDLNYNLTGQVWSCGKDFVIDNSGGQWPILYFCPGQSGTYSSCISSNIIRLDTEQLGSSYNCWGDTKLCKALKLN